MLAASLANTKAGRETGFDSVGLIELEDAVIASRGRGGDVQIEQTHKQGGRFALRGGGAGLLAGLLLGARLARMSSRIVGVRVIDEDVANRDKTARLWETASGREVRRFEGHSDAVTSARYSPDGSRVLTSSLDKTARLWETTTGQELRRFEGHLPLPSRITGLR